MFSGKFRRKLASVDPFQLIPVALFPHEINENGLIALNIPKFKNETFGKLFLSRKAKPYFVIDLDDHGSRMFKHINGENSISQVFEKVRNDGKEPIEQLEERGFIFIQHLFNHKYITFKQLQT